MTPSIRRGLAREGELALDWECRKDAEKPVRRVVLNPQHSWQLGVEGPWWYGPGRPWVHFEVEFEPQYIWDGWEWLPNPACNLPADLRDGSELAHQRRVTGDSFLGMDPEEADEARRDHNYYIQSVHAALADSDSDADDDSAACRVLARGPC